MAEWSCTIYGLPIGKARPRTVRLPNGMISSYTPKKTRRWEESIALQAAQTRPEQLLDGPLACQMVFYLPRPTSRPMRELFPDRKPDLDNLAKSVVDALEGVVYAQDSRVVTKILHKRYHSQPGVDVWIAEVVGGDEPAGLEAWVPPLPVELQKGGRTG